MNLSISTTVSSSSSSPHNTCRNQSPWWHAGISARGLGDYSTAVYLLALFMLAVASVLPTARGQVVVDTFPYTETFDGTPTCSDCSSGGLESDCLQIGTDLGWIQEVAQDTAATNWIVWTGDAPTGGTGPKAGDHTSGSGNYLWVHQGTGVVANSDDDDGAPYCEPTPTAFVDQTVGIISPVFDFSSVDPSDTVFLRFWHWMYGLRVGTLQVQMSTTDSEDGPWAQNLTSVGLGPNSWQSTVVELPGVQGLSAVRLRFVAQFLPTYCPGGTFGCVYTGTSPHPDDMADQAFDDVEVFLSSNAPSLTPGTEDKAIWVDLTTRLILSGTTPFAVNHQGSWSDVATSLGSHTMLTWGGTSATGEAIGQVRMFDYYSRSFVLEQDTGQVPIARQRAGFVTLGGSNSSNARLALYGGRGKFGLTPDLVLINSLTGELEGGAITTTGTINCTDLTPSDFSHQSFPSEGARAVLDPLAPDGTVLYMTMGRSLVVQVNFVTRYTIDPATGACSLEALRPIGGSDPPLARWNHVVGAWSGPGGNRTYLFVFSGRFQPADSDQDTVLDDLRVFDVQAVEWLEEKPVADPSQKPSPRSGAAAATNRAGDKLVLFGGQDGGGTTVFADVYVLQYDLKFELWKRLSPGLDVASVPGRVHHLMLPMFFDDRLLDPTAPSSETSEGFMVYGGQLQGGQVSNHMAKLHFGNLDLTPVDTGGDDEDDPTIAIVLGVVLPFCCLFLLLLLALATAVAILTTWRSLVKRRLKRKYGIGQDPLPQEAAGALFISQGDNDVPLEDM